MRILHGYRDTSDDLRDPVLAIGIFDGLHIGHMKVLGKVLTQAGAGQDKAVLTFDPHPRIVLGNAGRSLRIMSLDHRLSMFKELGFDAVVLIKFTEHLAGLSPEEFVRRVLVPIGAKKVFVGDNFRFGSGKRGDVASLRDIGARYGIEVNMVGPVKKSGRTVSSTWLRELILGGDMQKASNLLRRPVSILGTVVSGDRLGKNIGFPTANVDPHHEVIPPAGIYAVKVKVHGNIYDGVLNVGYKPTFYGNYLRKRREPRIEAHILDFEGDLYGSDIEIFFIAKIRNEKRFRTREKLRSRIERDIFLSKNILSNYRMLQKCNWIKFQKRFPSYKHSS